MKAICLFGAAVIAVIIYATISMYGSKEQDAVRILQDTHGVKVTSIGYSWLGCSEDDNFSHKWAGVNEDGKTVKGHACAGFFKGTTIRFK